MAIETPDQILAKRITERLKTEGFLLDEDTEQVKTKLGGGNLKKEDWQVAVQKTVDKEAQQ